MQNVKPQVLASAAPARAETEPLQVALTVAEAVKVAGVGRSTIYGELAAGRLKARKLGKRTLIPASALREWLAALPDYSPAAPHKRNVGGAAP